MPYAKSLYFHWLWWNIETGKAKSFYDLFSIQPVPWWKNPDNWVRFFEENCLTQNQWILVWSSAGVLPIIAICQLYPDNIWKVILLNPATSMVNINTIPSSIRVRIFSWTNDYGRNLYMFGDNPEPHISIVSIPWNHEFSGRDEMINEIIGTEISID